MHLSASHCTCSFVLLELCSYPHHCQSSEISMHFYRYAKKTPSSTRLMVGLSVGGQHCAAFPLFLSPQSVTTLTFLTAVCLVCCMFYVLHT